MNDFIREKCPSWADDTYLEYDLFLGNDSDSLLSCNLLEYMTNGLWKVNYFYNFQNVYRHEKTGLPAIGVDMAFTKNVRTFDNHVTRQYNYSKYNKHMMNPNVYYEIAAKDNYYKKYPFSTLMLIMAYYEIPLPDSDIGKDIVLAVDSAFKGHYKSKKNFKDIHTTWLERMGYSGLIDRLNKNTSQYYYNLQKHFGLGETVYIYDGLLSSNIDFEALQPYFDFPIGLPEQEFKLIKKFENNAHSTSEPIPERDKLISLAYTGKDYVSYTYKP